ncbi:aromatic acid exporter family protein [Enterococcus ratti]|uniref:Putative aromatic acid exporter C-terminal domain-containing protein n=1 Tax=Enterococcus ratti TaxID=150033 RepID=A0A1L8WEI8_9ENTE|nr:aromatic acid exporter family protein [Enterococcus ratti]OJG79430.1 hypothetical protein RV14_GL000853 [Enterococcus ratti]
MRIGMRTIKTVVSGMLSMIVAQMFSLLFWPSAGIIALLSVGNTKRSTLRTGISRFVAFVLATVLALISFFILGYTILGFSLFLLLFIPFTVFFKLTDGIVINSVLVTHYLSERNMCGALIGNEASLMAIGVFFALVANSYMPDIKKRLRKNQQMIEVQFRVILKNMADFLLSGRKENLSFLCEELLDFVRDSQLDAQNYQENYWIKQTQYYETYFLMRRTQVNVLKDMQVNLERIHDPVSYNKHIYGLLIYTAETFSEKNDGKELLKRIEEVYELYRKMPLPNDRLEFEDRAELFQFLQSFKSFIEIKAEFSQQVGEGLT